ncbi:MAG: ferric reductase-like transmembrane domain-containing protein [Nocardioides sp.]|nr:ferric reductase-like transmembrane domain-containing protein [Nocardioides sp.]
MTDGPLLWYLNRGSGLVVLALLTLSTVLGVLALGGRPGRGLPRFVTQALHRNIALVSVVALVVHVVTAVADTYVDIRWWQALVPWWGSTYEPLWLGLGTLALDLIAVIVVTSLLRTRLTHRAWRRVHLLSWGTWALGLAHGIGIGTDLRDLTDWAVLPTAVCVGAVLAALGWRLVPDRRAEVRA